MMKFALYREDDHGVRFFIDHFVTAEEVRVRIAQLSCGGHKQHYFIEVIEWEL